MSHFLKLSELPSIGIASAELIHSRLDADYYRSVFVDNEESLQNSGYKLELLGNMWTEANYGSLPDSIDYSSDGILLIRGTDIRGFSISPENELVKVPANYYDKFKKARVSPGDLLILVKGAAIDRPDSIALMPESLTRQAMINGSVFKVRLKPEYNKDYVAAFMLSRYFLLQKRRSVTNTGALYNDLETIQNYQIVLPDPKIQAYIGDKVRLAEMCQEEANKSASLANQMLFDILGWPIEFMNEQSHFVDAKIVNGRLDPKYYQNKYLQTLKIIHNYVAGYVLLDQFVESISNGSEYREYTSDGIPYLTVGDISDGRLLWKKAPMIPSSAPISDRGKLKVHDVLVVRTGSIGQAAFVHHACKDAIISSHFIKLRLSSPRRAPWIAFFLNSTVGKILLERIAYGAIQPQIGQDELLRIPIPLIDLRYENEIARYWTSQILLKEISEDLITEAKLDVENLIEGKLNISSLQTDNQQTMQWETIDSNIQEKLAEYA